MKIRGNKIASYILFILINSKFLEMIDMIISKFYFLSNNFEKFLFKKIQTKIK